MFSMFRTFEQAWDLKSIKVSQMAKIKKYKPLLLGLVFLIAGLSSFVKPSVAAPIVYIYPRMVTAEPSETFSVDVKITGATDLFAWEFSLGWNATLLDFVSVVEGDFLAFQPQGTFFGNQTEADESGIDYITVFLTTKGNFPGVSGDGKLATVTFRVQTIGETVLDLFDTKLRDFRLWPIEHTSTDGYFTNAAGPPRALFTFSPHIAEINQTITFNATLSYDHDGFITSYFWEFGDGNVANVAHPITTHAYVEAGTYTVALTVTDNASLYSTRMQIVKVRFSYDARVTDVKKPSLTTIVAGESVSIEVEVMNDGAKTISFDVTVYYDETPAAPAKAVTNLEAGQNQTLQFVWKTDGVAPGLYVIKAVASTVSGEINTGNNVKFDGTVEVKAPYQLPIAYIAVGVMSICVLSGGGILYFLRRRKSESTKTVLQHS
jgi:PKD repeat protein